MNQSFHFRVLCGVLALFLALVPHGLSRGFDTGHHHDLTASALKSLGFKPNAIKVAQLENWLVDYYSSQPLAGLEADLKKLHFDNLEDSTRVAIYWQRFNVNAKAAFEEAATDGDAMRVVVLLGIGLHAVQDFYTHSDWVEQHTVPPTSYLTDSYFDNPTIGGGALRTGHYPNNSPLQASDHGDGLSGSVGMNHDAYSRRAWDRAYIHAFCASRQWVQAVKSWVEGKSGGAAVWANAMDLSLSSSDADKLDKDLASAYRISEYAPGGHWKGPGSDSNLEFAAAIAAFTGSSDSVFVEHFKVKEWHKKLTDGLELTTPPSSSPTIPSMTHPFIAVRVQTLQVEELPVGVLESKIDSGGKADFFARITMDDQVFTEAMQLNRESVSPSWSSICFVPTSQASVAIRYELWDEDGGAGGEDDRCDIFETAGERAIAVTFATSSESLSGDFSGVHNSEASAIVSKGKLPDKDRATVKLVISRATLSP